MKFILVNLMPYRAKIKKEQTKKFASLMAMFGLAAGVSIAAIHGYMAVKIDNQLQSNKKIEAENERLDKQIAEISSLKDEIKLTLAKRQIVESLQLDRADGVNVLNEVANTLPDEVFLKGIKKVGNKLTLVGQTASNNRVSHYMSALDDGPVFKSPQLVEVRSIIVVPPTPAGSKTRPAELKSNEFNIVLEMEKEAPKETESKKGN